MIRILIAEPVSAKTVDQLNEIPEFEIIENTAPLAESMNGEIKNIDAVIAPATTPWPAAVLENAVNLKLIILTGGEPDPMDTQLANLKNTTIRRMPRFSSPSARAASPKKRERQESEMIDILKDFFNV